LGRRQGESADPERWKGEMMGHRTVKRVPIDFDWPIGEVWPGYYLGVCDAMADKCDLCKKFADLSGIKTTYECPDLDIHPPKGDGWQLWETTSEGSPSSPVFKTADELAEWCVKNATFFADIGGTKEEWVKSILGDMDGDSLAIMGEGIDGLSVLGKERKEKLK
jgi:hypothetical protein